MRLVAATLFVTHGVAANLPLPGLSPGHRPIAFERAAFGSLNALQRAGHGVEIVDVGAFQRGSALQISVRAGRVAGPQLCQSAVVVSPRIVRAAVNRVRKLIHGRGVIALVKAVYAVAIKLVGQWVLSPERGLRQKHNRQRATEQLQSKILEHSGWSDLEVRDFCSAPCAGDSGRAVATPGLSMRKLHYSKTLMLIRLSAVFKKNAWRNTAFSTGKSPPARYRAAAVGGERPRTWPS